PAFQGKRRIGDHAIEVGEVISFEEGWLTQGIASNNLEIFYAMQKEVDAGNGGSGQVLFLSEELAPQCFSISADLAHMMYSFEQHAPGSAGRIINRLSLLRVKDTYHQ